MTLGVTVGKFYPYHRGHEHLLRSARAQVERLVVLVCYKPGQQIPGVVRANWLRALHPDVEVIEVLDDIPNASEPWAARTLAVLGRRPDLAFTSEDYGPRWAELMGARHVAVDPERRHFPVSGTQLRADLGQHWAMLTAPAKAHFARRIALVGVESSGKSTLAQALAVHYQTVWVPEYGRYYWEGRRHTPDRDDWDDLEFLRIARAQIAWENDLAHCANRLLIADTDPLVTSVWQRRYCGHASLDLKRLAATHRYDLSILTLPDFGFVQDGTRESEQHRPLMQQDLLTALTAAQQPFITVAGPPEQRLAQAIAQIDPLLTFAPLAAP